MLLGYNHRWSIFTILLPPGVEVGLRPGNVVLDGEPSSPSTKMGHSSPTQLFGPCLLQPNGRPSQQLLISYSS